MEPSLETLEAALPDHIKSRILAHLFQPKPPAASTPSSRSRAQEGGGPFQGGALEGCQQQVPVALRGRSITQGPLVLDDFVPPGNSKALLEEARHLVEEQARSAGMGGAAADAKWADSKFRGDVTVFLRPAQLAASGFPALASFLTSTAAQLRPWLEGQGYDVGGRPSFQLGCYPGGGARYVRHRDASLTCPHRTVTALVYLNQGWRAEDGGELYLYHWGTSPPQAPATTTSTTTTSGGGSDGSSTGNSSGVVRSGLEEGHAATVVPPVGGRLVVFDSRTEHEVLPSHAPRYALAVWFSRAEQQAGINVGSGDLEQQAGEQGASPVGSGGPGVQPRVPAEGGGSSSGSRSQAEQQEGVAGSASQHLRGANVARPPAAAATVAAAAATPAAAAAAEGEAPDQCAAGAAGTAAPLDMGLVTQPGHIFVSIAAYRDSETQWTLLDLFEKAERAERVRVGVVWQVDWAQDAPFVRITRGGEPWLPQVRQIILDWREATGPCKARALAQQLWSGEEFVLQIDSHMRFVPGWDMQLLGMLQQAEQQAQHSRVVLSTYPPGYTGEGREAVVPPSLPTTLLCATHFGPDRLLRIKGRALRCTPLRPLPALFWAAGLSFSRAQLLDEAPYDPSLSFLFFGEEMYQLVRMWRRGWDVFAPPFPVAFHLWSRGHRPTFQKDSGLGSTASEQDRDRGTEGSSPEGAAPLGPGAAAAGAGAEGLAASAAAQRRRSQQRVIEALTGQAAAQEGSPASNKPEKPEEGSGGYVRSLEQFYKHCGVDFRAGMVGERAKWGGRAPEEFQPSLQDLLAQQAEQAEQVA